MAAALSLFVTKGFYGTAVPEIAKQAKVAAGTIYHHFRSKEELVNVVFRKWKLAIAMRVQAKFPPEGTAQEQFHVIWQEMAALAMEHPEAFAFLDLHHHQSYLDDESRGVDEALKTFGAQFVRQAQARGELKPADPVLLMELIFGAFHGMIRAHWEGRVKLSHASVDAAEAVCWDAVRVIDG